MQPMSLLLSLGLMALCIGYTNGANSNFKGVATLYGSGTATYRGAVVLGTAATFAGGICSLFWATGLIASFSGGGIVPDTVVGSPHFLFAVAGGASGTVLFATLLGLPISTTHGLIGGLVGAGLVSVGSDI